MNKRLASIVSALLLSMVFTAQASWAAKAFITESGGASIYAGPASNKKVLGTLAPGTAVEISKISEWTLIRYTSSSGEPRDGWVMTQTIGPRPPDDTVVKEMQSESNALKDKLALADKEKTDFSTKEKDLTDKLAKLSAAHEALKAGSTNYVKLKQEYDGARAELKDAQDQIHQLKQENENLKISQMIKWFGVGALVLLVGWFIGWFSGKRRPRRSSGYHL